MAAILVLTIAAIKLHLLNESLELKPWKMFCRRHIFDIYVKM